MLSMFQEIYWKMYTKRFFASC